MDIKLIVALIGLLGVAASTLVQYYLGSRSEKVKKSVEIQSQAYLDLLNVVAEIASSSKQGRDRNLEQFKKLTQAKSRVVLLGSNAVVENVHIFFTKYGDLKSDESLKSFSKIIYAMRNDISSEKSLSDVVLLESLFNKKVDSVS
jgi:hypothetical protein